MSALAGHAYSLLGASCAYSASSSGTFITYHPGKDPREPLANYNPYSDFIFLEPTKVCNANGLLLRQPE
jgi:hypothetical protein